MKSSMSERVSNSFLYALLNSALTLSITSLSTANDEHQAALEEARKTISTLEQALAAATEDTVDPTDEGSVKKPVVPKGKRIAIFDAMGPRVSRDQYQAIQVSTTYLVT